jgi:ATP-binding cassette subfamily B protein
VRQIVRESATLLRLCWREDKRRLLIAVVLVVSGSVATPLIALALKVLTNEAIAGNVGAAMGAGVALAVLAMGVLTLSHFAHIAYFELSELNMLTIDDELMQLANGSAGIQHQENPEYADRLAVLSRETDTLDRALEALLHMAGLAVALVITGVLLAMLNPILLLLPVLAVPPLITGRWAENRLDKARERSARDVRLSWHLLRLATRAEPVKEVRIFGLEEEVRRRHNARWKATTAELWRAHRIGTVLRTGGQLFFAVGYLGSVLLIVSQAIRGRRSIGDVVLAVTLAAQVNQQTAQAVALLQQLQAMARTLGRLRWLQELVVANAPAAADLPTPAGIEAGIRLEGVDFCYPGTDRTVLQVDELELPAGSTVAIVGENGAGKTTLVKLLCRFYEPSQGRLLVDGVDFRRFDIDEWRDRIATGFQDFMHFELIARETVGVGDLPQIDDEPAVEAALVRAQAEDVIHRLENGLATQLGKSYADGTELSGGQWQKLALGRAMMRQQPLLLVLDEPTAALDAETEHALFERYAEGARRVGALTGGVTLLVSHRFSTVRMADHIIVIADGKVLEHGSHDELVASGGLYAELYELQAAGYR